MRRGARVALAVIAVAALTAPGVAWAAQRWFAAPVDGAVTMLVIGSDSGPNRAGDPLTGRADALHLLVVSPDHQHVSIVDIPRDTYVPVPGRGRSKINACLNGGPDRCVGAVAGLFGVDIDHWILTDFQGLAAGIDLLGGLTLEVEQRLADPFSGTDLHPGVQMLDGGQVLAYSRDRKSRASGDIGRSAAQARVLTALHAQLRAEEPSVTRVAQLLELLRSTTVTDADPATLLRLAYLAMRIDPGAVHTRVLDGRPGSAGGASVVFITPAGEATIADLRDDLVLTPPPPPPPPPSG